MDEVTVRDLAEAVRAGEGARVEAMLRARGELADLTISYGDERRPIHFAVIRRSAEMVRLLMRHGASSRAGIYPHRDATTAWTMANERGYAEIVRVIEEEEAGQGEAGSGPEEAPGDEAARAAVAAGDVEWVRARREAGTLANPVRWDGGGLLTVAVRHNQAGMLELLLDAGFDPDERVACGDGDWVAYSQGFPLWECAALGRREMAEMLLRRGANPNVHVDSSGSAVHSAYSHKQWEMVELLRRHGGLVTPDTAALYRQTDLARQMLDEEARGVLVEGMVPAGKSLAEELLRFGASGGAVEIVGMALARIDWPRGDPRWFRVLTEPLYFWHHIPWLYAGNREFDRPGYLACFRLILKRCDANLSGGFGRTALHEVAAMRDHITEEEAVEFARALLDAGARLDARDELLRSTALGWVCRWGRVEVARLLLDRGADAAEADAELWARPLAWALKKGHEEVSALLRGRVGRQ